MSERTQRILWILETIIAICLVLVTVYLYAKSRRRVGRSYLIAYTAFQPDFGRPTIYVTDLKGTEPVPLTKLGAADAFPVCEPLQPSGNGEPRVAFLRSDEMGKLGRNPNIGASGSVCIVNASGGEVTKVSTTIEYVQIIAPAWSPDGKQIAFAAVEDLNDDGQYLENEAGIYLCDLEAKEVKRLVNACVQGSRLLWSPSGPYILVPVKKSDSPVAQMHILDIEHAQLTPILDGNALAACWSPNGQYIAAYSLMDRRIHILYNDGSEDYQLEAPAGYVIDLTWIPASLGIDDSNQNQERLLAVSSGQLGDIAGQLLIRSIEPGSHESWTTLTNTQDGVFYPIVSPDGQYVAFTLFTNRPAAGSGSNPRADLYILRLGEHEPYRLTFDPGFEGLATWIPSSRT